MTDQCNRLLPQGAEWDDELGLPRTLVEGRPYHTMWIAAEYACALVEAGTPACLGRAELTLWALIDYQDVSPASATFGNFRWEFEDSGVEDLNAVVFFAIRIIPMLYRHHTRLSPGLLDALRPVVRRAIEAIERIDVGPEYTNIISQSVAALIIGGRFLEDRGIEALGEQRFHDWVALTDESGLAHEFNSPVYTEMTVTALRLIEELATNQSIRACAAQVRLRQILSVALHINASTGRMSAPHCRAYFPFLVAQTRPEIEILKEWVAKGWAPDWMLRLCEADKGQVRETSDRARGVHLTSYHGDGFSLGTTSRELDTQNNRYIAAQSTVFAAQFFGKSGAAGTLFSKYITNDQWLGSYATTSSRSSRQVFFDHGAFLGVQDGLRMIGAYRPRALDAWNRTSSAKICLVVADCNDVRGLWAGSTPITRLPADVGPNETVTLDLGGLYVVLKSLSSKELQPGLANRLVERKGMLVFEINDYEGPAKTFWSQAQPGAFYQGAIQSGFYAEVFPAKDNNDPASLAALVDSGKFINKADPPCRPDRGERKWTVSYERDAQGFGMEIDLHGWKRLKDWDTSGPIGMPMLESKFARQSRNGLVELGGARLACGAQAAWLAKAPQASLWAAGVHPGAEQNAIRLNTPDGSVEVLASRGASILWDNGSVYVDHTDPTARIVVEGGKLVNQNDGFGRVIYASKPQGGGS